MLVTDAPFSRATIDVAEMQLSLIPLMPEASLETDWYLLRTDSSL